MPSLLLLAKSGVYATTRLVAECDALGVPVTQIEVGDLKNRDLEADADSFDALYVRMAWPELDRVAELAQNFRARGKRVVDAIVADGKIDEGKLVMYDELREAGIRFPETVAYVHAGERLARFPYILKWTYGMQGKEVYLVQRGEQHEHIAKKHGAGELLWQEFLPVEREFKVYTVGYRSVPFAQAFEPRPNGFRVDHKTAQTEPIESCGDVVAAAETAARTCGFELAKTDVAVSGGVPYVLETNRRPGFEFFEKKTGYNLARDFARYAAGV